MLDSHCDKKIYLIKSIEDHGKKKIVETSMLFSMTRESKFRMFNFVMNKPNAVNEEHYAFVFVYKNKKKETNMFAVAIFKEKTKNSYLNWGVAISLSNNTVHPKKLTANI